MSLDITDVNQEGTNCSDIETPEQMECILLKGELQSQKDQNKMLVNTLQDYKMKMSSYSREILDMKKKQFSITAENNWYKEEMSRSNTVIYVAEEKITNAFASLLKIASTMTNCKILLARISTLTHDSCEAQRFKQNLLPKENVLQRHKNGPQKKHRVRPMVKGLPISNPTIKLQRVTVPSQTSTESERPNRNSSLSTVRTHSEQPLRILEQPPSSQNPAPPVLNPVSLPVEDKTPNSQDKGCQEPSESSKHLLALEEYINLTFTYITEVSENLSQGKTSIQKFFSSPGRMMDDSLNLQLENSNFSGESITKKQNAGNQISHRVGPMVEGHSIITNPSIVMERLDTSSLIDRVSLRIGTSNDVPSHQCSPIVEDSEEESESPISPTENENNSSNESNLSTIQEFDEEQEIEVETENKELNAENLQESSSGENRNPTQTLSKQEIRPISSGSQRTGDKSEPGPSNRNENKEEPQNPGGENISIEQMMLNENIESSKSCDQEIDDKRQEPGPSNEIENAEEEQKPPGGESINKKQMKRKIEATKSGSQKMNNKREEPGPSNSHEKTEEKEEEELAEKKFINVSKRRKNLSSSKEQCFKSRDQEDIPSTSNTELEEQSSAVEKVSAKRGRRRKPPTSNKEPDGKIREEEAVPSSSKTEVVEQLPAVKVSAKRNRSTKAPYSFKEQNSEIREEEALPSSSNTKVVEPLPAAEVCAKRGRKTKTQSLFKEPDSDVKDKKSLPSSSSTEVVEQLPDQEMCIKNSGRRRNIVSYKEPNSNKKLRR